MGLTHYPNGLTSFGVVLPSSGRHDISGTTYFCDGNFGNDSNDGFSREAPFKTLAVAFATSHADIARNSDRWARRNTIYIAGDRFTENLVAFPQKTDIIGVGSCDAFKGAGILGNHAPVNTHLGTRFFNVNFFPAASTDIITIASTTSGLEFHDCGFVGKWGAYTAPSAIDTTASPMLKVIGSRFNGPFSGDTIDLGAGDISGLVIQGNTMAGGASGGVVATGTLTAAGAMSLGLIADNYIQVAGFTILDGDDNALNVVGNRCISAGVSEAAAFEIDEGHAVDNVITYNDTTSVMVPIIPSA